MICLDLTTGKILWERVAHAGVPAKPHHIKNTLASETPTTDGERIYAYFGNLGMLLLRPGRQAAMVARCCRPRETQYGWGTSISPIVYQDRVYIVNDNNEKSYLLALNKKTGEERVADRPRRKDQLRDALRLGERRSAPSWSPRASAGPARTISMANCCGNSRANRSWRFPRRSPQFGNAVSHVRPRRVGRQSAVRHPAGRQRRHLARRNQTSNDYIVWSQDKAGPYHPTPLIVGDTMYILYDRGFMAAYDAKTGREIYARKRIPNGKALHQLSLDLRRQDLLPQRGWRDVCHSSPAPQFEILYTNALAEDDMGMATPVIVGDKLLIRTSARMYCIGSNAMGFGALSRRVVRRGRKAAAKEFRSLFRSWGRVGRAWRPVRPSNRPASRPVASKRLSTIRSEAVMGTANTMPMSPTADPKTPRPAAPVTECSSRPRPMSRGSIRLPTVIWTVPGCRRRPKPSKDRRTGSLRSEWAAAWQRSNRCWECSSTERPSVRTTSCAVPSHRISPTSNPVAAEITVLVVR